MDPAIRKVASKLEACLTAVRSVALTDDLFRDLVYRADDAADPAWWCVVQHRTVGDGPVRFLHESPAVHVQENVVHPRRRATPERGLDQRADDVPDFRQHVDAGCPIERGCLSPSAGQDASL